MLLQDFGKLVAGEKIGHPICSATLERQAEGHCGPFCLAAVLQLASFTCRDPEYRYGLHAVGGICESLLFFSNLDTPLLFNFLAVIQHLWTGRINQIICSELKLYNLKVLSSCCPNR